MDASPQAPNSLDEEERRVWRFARGLLLCFSVAAAATFLSEHYGAPVMLFALLLGMAFHFLADNARCAAGVEFTSKRLLRIGVGLLGATIQDVAQVVGAGYAFSQEAGEVATYVKLLPIMPA